MASTPRSSRPRAPRHATTRASAFRLSRGRTGGNCRRDPEPRRCPWRSLAALSLNDLGRKQEALELAREELDYRAAGARRAPSASRCGHLAGRGRREGAAAREAVDVLAGSPARLEHARALVDLGAVLRRSNSRSEARQSLREGLERAQRCGALRWWSVRTMSSRRPAPTAERSPQRSRRAHRERAAGCSPGCRRLEQQGDRPGAVRDGQDHRAAPQPRLPQARPELAQTVGRRRRRLRRISCASPDQARKIRVRSGVSPGRSRCLRRMIGE